MSWWNTSNITSLASKALKNAQKKIDEALDISEHEQAAEGSLNIHTDLFVILFIITQFCQYHLKGRLQNE